MSIISISNSDNKCDYYTRKRIYQPIEPGRGLEYGWKAERLDGLWLRLLFHTDWEARGLGERMDVVDLTRYLALASVAICLLCSVGV